MKDTSMRVADVIHGTIHMSEIEKDIMSTAIFNRLHYVSQTSTVYMTYPSNNSKRFDHSLGTMKLCGDIFYYSVANSNNQTVSSFIECLKSETKKILDSWKKPKNISQLYVEVYGDDNLAKGFIPIESIDVNLGIYRQFIPSNIDEKNYSLYCLFFQAIRVCGMLHDIGHPPFSHIVEKGLNNAYKDVPNSSSLKTALGHVYRKNQDLHEVIGNNLCKSIIYDVLMNHKKDTLEDKLFYMLVFQIAERILCEKDTICKDLHRIVSGSLDGDRLDNINRDSFMTGFDNNILNYNQLINSMILVGNKKSGFKFCPHIKTLLSIEECFAKRWKNYKRMTHHHNVIKTNFMLQKVIYILSIDFCNNNGKDYNSDAISLPYNISGLWLPLDETSSNRKKLIRFIQWNDNWLMTILQKSYLEMFLSDDETCRKSQLYYFLEELIESKKNYKSLVKRYEDFQFVDNRFIKVFESYLEVSKSYYLNVINTLSSSGSTTDPVFDINSFVNDFINLKVNNGSFFASEISDIVSCYFPKTNLFEEISETMRTNFYNLYSDIIDDCFIVAKQLKIGTDRYLQMYDPCNKEPLPFVDISHIDETLKMEKSYMPEFYLYIKWKDNYVSNNEKIIELREKLGEIAAIEASNYIKEIFDKYLPDEFNKV